MKFRGYVFRFPSKFGPLVFYIILFVLVILTTN